MRERVRERETYINASGRRDVGINMAAGDFLEGAPPEPSYVAVSPFERERESYEAIVEELLHIIPMLKHVGPSPIFSSHLKGKHLEKKKEHEKNKKPGHSFILPTKHSERSA